MKTTHRLLAVLALSLVTVAGCQDPNPQPDPRAERAADVLNELEKATAQAEPAIDSVENLVGGELSPETVGKIEGAAQRLADIADKIHDGATIAAPIPGPQQGPIAAIAVIAGALASLAGTVAGIFRRRHKKTSAAFDTLAAAVESMKKRDPIKAADLTDLIKEKAIESGTLATLKTEVKRAIQ